MESKELRIGNLLKYDDGTIVEVLTVSSRDIVVKRFPQPLNISVLHPILLTPEILEQAGFVKTGRYAIGAGGYITYEKDRVVLLHPKKGHPFVLAFHETQVQSVHQLQNLYHALTGEELEINLT